MAGGRWYVHDLDEAEQMGVLDVAASASHVQDRTTRCGGHGFHTCGGAMLLVDVERKTIELVGSSQRQVRAAEPRLDV